MDQWVLAILQKVDGFNSILEKKTNTVPKIL